MAIGALGGQPQEQPQPQLQHDEADGQHHQQTHEGHLLPPTTAALAALSMSSALSPPVAAAAAEAGGSEDTAALERALAGYCAVPDATAASATAMVESDAEEAGAAADGRDAPLLAPQQIQRQQEDAVGHLNRVLLHVQRAKRLEGVVGLMGPYLTSEDGKVGWLCGWVWCGMYESLCGSYEQ